MNFQYRILNNTIIEEVKGDSVFSCTHHIEDVLKLKKILNKDDKYITEYSVSILRSYEWLEKNHQEFLL
jgi:hypothetical protein